MRTIPLANGLYCIVDSENYSALSKYKWYITQKGYVARSGKYLYGRIHRIIMKAPSGREVDHINCNKLDNRKENLRVCTASQNQMNRLKLNKNNKSGFRGVWWSKNKEKWIARIRKNRKFIDCGFFENKEDAARAYNRKAVILFGEFARLNTI